MTSRNAYGCTAPRDLRGAVPALTTRAHVPFQPDTQIRKMVLDAIQAKTDSHAGEDTARRSELLRQLERLRDLYMMGDFTKGQYIMRRQALEEELQPTTPPTDPDLDRAQALLEDFAQFWEAERDPGRAPQANRHDLRAHLAEGRSDRRRPTA